MMNRAGGLALVMLFLTLHVRADDWRAQEARLNSLNIRVSSKKAEMEQLIEEKARTADKETLHAILTKMSVTQKELLEKEGQLRDLKNRLRFNYPEHGVEMDRKYTPLRREDLEKYEAEIGIDGKLNRVKQRVHEVYGKDAPGPPPPEAEENGKKDERPERSGRTDPSLNRSRRPSA